MKSIVKILSVSLLTLSLSGCAVFNNPATKSTATKKEKTEKKDKTKPAPAKKGAVQAKPATSEPKKKTPVNNAKPAAENKTKPEQQTVSGNQSSLYGEWLIQTVNGQKIKGDDRPFLFFDLKNSLFYGNNGCNVLNGGLVFSANNGVELTNVATSMRMCQPSSPTEYLINNAVNDVRRFSIVTTGDESLLYLSTKEGRTLMTLRRHNIGFANGTWMVTAIDGIPVKNDNLKFLIDIPERKIHGYAGCNIVNGKIFIDPDKSNSLQFQNLVSTRMSCPDASTESKLLVALEEVVSCHYMPDGTLVMRAANGEDKVKMERFEPSVQ